MEREAADAPDVASRLLADNAAIVATLADRLGRADPPLVVTCARGSSDNAATFAKYLIETTLRTPVASYAPSVSSIYGTRWQKLAGALFLAVSQSGRSPDLVASARAARESGALVVALLNDTSAPLASVADVVLPLRAGPEVSVAATKSFIATLVAILQLVAAWSRDAALASAVAAAPDALAAVERRDGSAVIEALREARSMYVIGRGLTLSTAQEAALKLKETCGIHAEAYSAAELQHGPLAIVGPGFPVLMLTPGDAAGAQFAALAERLTASGARVMIAGARGPAGSLALAGDDAAPAALRPVLQIAGLYPVFARLARARGLDPDRPRHLQKVTETR
jgi:glucosamine--fructose-6-phosphate aminotransferase (isomerizing)